MKLKFTFVTGRDSFFANTRRNPAKSRYEMYSVCRVIHLWFQTTFLPQCVLLRATARFLKHSYPVYSIIKLFPRSVKISQTSFRVVKMARKKIHWYFSKHLGSHKIVDCTCTYPEHNSFRETHHLFFWP